jgi:hypothetical protein
MGLMSEEDAAVGEIEIDNPFLQDINESLPVSRRIRAGIDTGILTAGMVSRELGGHRIYRVRRRRGRPRKDDSA